MEISQVVVWPVVLYGVLVFALIGGMIFLSWVLGERHHSPGRVQPYESGILPTGSARVRYGAHYYLVAVFFVLFDIEAVFIFAWAVAFRQLAWPGYIAATLFIATLFIGLIYIWKLGGLDFYKPRQSRGGSLER